MQLELKMQKNILVLIIVNF